MNMKIVNDTLKVNGKWSKTNLTMLTAYLIAIYMAIFDLYRNGFNFEVFCVFIALSTGMKYFDSIKKPETIQEDKTN